MFKINLNYNFFKYPWLKLSFLERIKQITEDTEKRRVIYFYEVADNSTFRYRVYNMYETLLKSQLYEPLFFFTNEIDFILRYIRPSDIIVVVRCRWSVALDKLFSRVNQIKAKIFFDVDDLVFDVSAIPMIMNTLGVNFTEAGYNYWFSMAARLHLTGSNCSAYITTNEYLANQIKKKFDKPTYVIPNYLNNEQIKLSETLVKMKAQMSSSETKLLGYFSGTPSHNNDFASISSDLYHLMMQNKNINLRIVGYLELPKFLNNLLNMKRIEQLPLQNYLDLQIKIAECDINLIPLILNNFTNCKSEIKYFESGVVDTISVASPNYIYQEIIKDGHNGYLALQGEWQDKIENAISSRPSSIFEETRKHIENNYYSNAILLKIENIFSLY